jgi:predicted RNase H-like nuclease (RuvC/YqgF family)
MDEEEISYLLLKIEALEEENKELRAKIEAQEDAIFHLENPWGP